MFNVHASGGSEMMSTVRAAIEDEANTLRVPRPKILAVTVLTSITPEVLRNELKISMDLPQYVVALANLAKSCGLDGVVASPKEITSIRDACGKDFIILTPGIRPATAEAHDQKRVMTPSAAIKLGADYLVVGRPILEARDRNAAASAILQEMIDAQC
jgi:orotidine-5'-phosphate decarboxylase